MFAKIIWPLFGTALIIFGCWLISVRGSMDFLPLVLVGLVLLSPQKARDVVLLLREFFAGGTQSGAAESGGKKDDLINQNQSVKGFTEAPPEPDEWSRVLQPVLHQASYYTVPTYYLNINLHFIDWNIAFEVVFGELLAKLRNKHVNYFIAELANAEEVFDHAREFTKKVELGNLPLVDMEPLIYESPKYGHVSFVKVATQLHDAAGKLHGWAVALMIREIDWTAFQKDLYNAVEQDKLWSLYASSYDRVLLKFPEYGKLIAAVTAVIPSGSRAVADLGAGTGNVTAALLKAGHRVTAVESNLAMLERLRAKHLDATHLTVVKSSVEHLSFLKACSFDAVVMMNVLYAVEDPLACLREASRLLKPGGALGLSTTHAGTQLDPLLNAIRNYLRDAGLFDALASDYERLYDINKHIEKTIARRHSVEEYCRWVQDAGFEILKTDPTAYYGAVVVIHARKIDTAGAGAN